MPELPEVETVRRGLAPYLVDRRIEAVTTRRPDLRFPLPPRFRERLVGHEATGIERRAKYLIVALSSGEDLVMHLGMTGRFTIVHDDITETPGEFEHETKDDAAHDHVELKLSDGTRIIYNDPRRFGFMVMMAHEERPAHPLFRALGVEPLGHDLTADYLAKRAKGKKTNLKAFLMDQRVIAGLGNIYASEALHRARLSPNRLARSLAVGHEKSESRAQTLVTAIKEVLANAIHAGGSTLRNYRHADGNSGAFQKQFLVYDRGGEKCLRRGCGGTIKRIVQSGRATFYCPRCQR